MAYATVDELRDLLTQVPDTAANNAKLATLLDVATLVVSGYMGFTYGGYTAGTDTDVQAAATSYWLPLPPHKAGSITAVTEVYRRFATDESEETVENWDEEPGEGDHRLYSADGWEAGDWYRVTGDWGYGAPPDDVVRVTLEVAVNAWGGADRRMFTDVIGVEGSGAVAYQRALTNIQRMILDNARVRAHGVVVV